jgi:ABC-type nitrate/sulfonate/bicarbonate transport system substrate-binding protein
MVQVIGLSDIPLPIAVAEANGLFAKHGVMVHAEKVQDAERLRTAMLEGSANIAESRAEDLISLVDSTQADAIGILGGEKLTGELIAQPNIKSVSDLRGKTIILDKMDSLYSFGMRRILLLNKVTPGTDCELKVVGPAPERLQAMILNKDYAATIQDPPMAVMAKRAGMVSLGPATALLKMDHSQGLMAFAQRQWAYQHGDQVKGYIAAYVEAQRWLMSPENKDRAIEIMVKESKLPRDVSEETYKMKVQDANGWTKDAQFDTKGFENDLKLWREFQDVKGVKQRAAEKYYDLSFYRDALSMVKSSH